jgi:hypothetical protein
MGSILGLYKQDAPRRNDLRVGTPDPTKYHDPGAIKLEGGNHMTMTANMPGNHGFSGLRGVMIPRATAFGGSLGHNPHKAPIIRIDPELIGGDGIVVDLSKVNQKDMENAVMTELQAGYEDPADAMTAAFAHFASRMPGPRHQQETKSAMATPQQQSSGREAPLQFSGSYVVPKASPGGGQLRPGGGVVAPASFRSQPAQEAQPQIPVADQTPQQAPPLAPNLMPSMPKQAVQQQQQPYQPPPVTQASFAEAPMDPYSAPPPRSLVDAFDEQPTPQSMRQAPALARPLRRVTFEIPRAGQPVGFYHEVIRSGMCLILVYDHSHAGQFIWFPPTLEDEGTKEPIAIAAYVHGNSKEPDTLYKVQTTPVRFMYRSEEFCVLLIEKEKVMTQEE